MIDLELAKKIGATHYRHTHNSYGYYKKNCSDKFMYWSVLYNEWRPSVVSQLGDGEINKINFNEPSIETLQSALDKSQLKVMELTEQLAEAKGVKIGGISREEFDKGMLKSMQQIAKSCGAKFAVDIGYGNLPRLVESLINPPKKLRKKFEYVKCELTPSEIAKAMIDGDIFYDKYGLNSYAWSGYRFEVNNGRAVEIRGEFYRRTEVEVDWRDECVSYFKTTPYLHEVDCLIDLINGNSDERENEALLEMCRVALRATGELTDKPE